MYAYSFFYSFFLSLSLSLSLISLLFLLSFLALLSLLSPLSALPSPSPLHRLSHSPGNLLGLWHHRLEIEKAEIRHEVVHAPLGVPSAL